MKEFKLLKPHELELLDNLELLEYKKELYLYGYEMESYLEELRNNYNYTIKVLEDRIIDIQYDMAIIQAEREDNVGDIDAPDHYVH